MAVSYKTLVAAYRKGQINLCAKAETTPSICHQGGTDQVYHYRDFRQNLHCVGLPGRRYHGECFCPELSRINSSHCDNLKTNYSRR